MTKALVTDHLLTAGTPFSHLVAGALRAGNGDRYEERRSTKSILFVSVGTLNLWVKSLLGAVLRNASHLGKIDKARCIHPKFTCSSRLNQ